MSAAVALRRGAPRRARGSKAAPLARRATVRLPMPARNARRLLLATATTVALLVLGTTAWLVRLPETVWLMVADAAAGAGFDARDVEVTGLVHMQRLPVYSAALDARSSSMLLVDLDEIRARLLLLPWVKDASVSRIWPDRLRIDIVERQPAAVWQHRQRLAVVDAQGNILQWGYHLKFAQLPTIIGADARRHAGALTRLLADYPELAARQSAAHWMGGRRWDLHFKSGETLMLPEGAVAAHDALDRFARLEASNGLLGKGFARFDMRLDGRMVVRLSREPGAAVPTVAAPGTEI